MDVLAHNGGIDEIGLVLGPIAILAGILWLANRRATRLEAEAKVGAGADADTAKAKEDRPTSTPDSDGPHREERPSDPPATDARRAARNPNGVAPTGRPR